MSLITKLEILKVNFCSEVYLDVGGVCVGGGDVRLPVFGWFGQVLGVRHDPFHPWPSWQT